MDNPGRYNQAQRCQRLLNRLNAELASVQAVLAKLKAAGLRAVRPAPAPKPKHGSKAA